MKKILSLIILAILIPSLSMASDSCEQSAIEKPYISQELLAAIEAYSPKLSRIFNEKLFKRFLEQKSKTYKNLLAEEFQCIGNRCTLKYHDSTIDTIIHYELVPLKKGGQSLVFQVESFKLKDPTTASLLKIGERPKNLSFHFSYLLSSVFLITDRILNEYPDIQQIELIAMNLRNKDLESSLKKRKFKLKKDKPSRKFVAQMLSFQVFTTAVLISIDTPLPILLSAKSALTYSFYRVLSFFYGPKNKNYNIKMKIEPTVSLSEKQTKTDSLKEE
ncbi:MAG: hypothetical protein CL674_12845 [Bdellovibrionaceae bacterium]|nr:hypothetical protein [Pseudobdellovibrionaceae bacterium]|tara:strand:+ start:26840 stop:27664 length:825 start_codon:yes stop_codon:yes gene_type:complete